MFILKYQSKHYETDLECLRSISNLSLDELQNTIDPTPIMERGLVNCTRHMLKIGYKFPLEYISICCNENYTICLTVLAKHNYIDFISSQILTSSINCAVKNDNLECLKLLNVKVFNRYTINKACKYNSLKCLEYILHNTSKPYVDSKILITCIKQYNWNALKMCLDSCETVYEVSANVLRALESVISTIEHPANYHMYFNYQYLMKNPYWNQMIVNIGNSFNEFVGYQELAALYTDCTNKLL